MDLREHRLLSKHPAGEGPREKPKKKSDIQQETESQLHSLEEKMEGSSVEGARRGSRSDGSRNEGSRTESDRRRGERTEGDRRDRRGERTEGGRRDADPLRRFTDRVRTTVLATRATRDRWVADYNTREADFRSQARNADEEGRKGFLHQAQEMVRERNLTVMLFDALIALQTEAHPHEGQQMVWDCEGAVYDFQWRGGGEFQIYQTDQGGNDDRGMIGPFTTLQDARDQLTTLLQSGRLNGDRVEAGVILRRPE